MTANISEFFAKLENCRSGYAYRGQENAEWELQSSALRRLSKLEIAPYLLDTRRALKAYFSYHRDELLDPARTAGFGVENGHELTDLELLAKLQHFGAATGLLDFSWNPLVALWFACQPNKKGETDGKVFAVNLNDQQNFIRAQYQTIREKRRIEDFLSSEKSNAPLYWEPVAGSDANARIIAQSSVFVIGRPYIRSDSDVVTSIRIDANQKEALRRELEEYLGITDVSLYRDVYGFSSVNGADSPIRRTMQAETALHRGNQLHQQQEYSASINYYDQCLEQAGEIGEIHLLRANSKAALDCHPEACSDYDKAKQCEKLFLEPAGANSRRTNEFYRTLHFNRGNSRARVGNFEGAEADFGSAKKYCPTNYWLARVIFNRANILARLHRLEAARELYQAAIRRGGEAWDVPFAHAQYNKGNTLLMLGRLAEAKDAFEKSANASRPSLHAESNLQNLERVMELVDKSPITTVRTLPPSPTEGPVALVQILTTENEMEPTSVPFAGNVGNIGSTGGIDPLGLVGLPGGDGQPGGSGFGVIVIADEKSNARSES